MVWLAFFGAATALSPIADVRVGDDGERARVEVFCTRVCDAEPVDESTFLVTWARGDFTADISDKSQYLQAIHVDTRQYGAAVRVDTTRKPRAVTVRKCGPARLCFDFDFSAPKRKPDTRVNLADLENDLESLMIRTGYRQTLKTAATFPDTSSMAPTSARAVIAAAMSAAIRRDSPQSTCAAAQQALAADAWNLGAFQTVALCRSGREAEQYLRRLRLYADGSAARTVRPSLR